uniref:Uncharacterized protein n=1 Tax=Anguilla anguilla TaxID=7936 RepID=A0A0E9WMP7_ANGAN
MMVWSRAKSRRGWRVQGCHRGSALWPSASPPAGPFSSSPPPSPGSRNLASSGHTTAGW